MADTPQVGDKAPLVEGTIVSSKTDDGKPWKLSDIVGKKVVLLYFYPKDDTPGCTKQACGLRDRMGDLKEENVAVIGVSMDTVDSHKKFIEKYELNFPLVADPNGKITKAYGAGLEDRNLSRRISFLIGLDGKIKHVTDTMSAETHLTEMSDAVKKLES